MGAELPYQICEIGSICRMWRNTQNTHLPCSPISIHIFLAEGDVSNNSIYVVLSISIHTFLAEGDNKLAVARYTLAVFQSTPSLQKVTWIEDSYTVSVTISIHTFLAEGDGSRMSVWRAIPNFNPHLPCGRWHLDLKSQSSSTNFNPHLPRGRWQRHRKYYTRCNAYFNPHLPRGRWQNNLNVTLSINIFQSTPSSRKVTIPHGTESRCWSHFNPHLPRGRWRFALEVICRTEHISIHTFLAEGDRRLYIWLHTLMNFNPHLPRGRWQVDDPLILSHYPFQSTPSSRKVTLIGLMLLTSTWFQSTPSSRKVTCFNFSDFIATVKFQSTPSSRKVTRFDVYCRRGWTNFNPHLPRGRWRSGAARRRDWNNFNPHLPRGRWPWWS